MARRTVFEVDLESFEEKPWRQPGVDITDYFNFQLTEAQWKDYCKRLVRDGHATRTPCGTPLPRH